MVCFFCNNRSGELVERMPRSNTTPWLDQIQCNPNAESLNECSLGEWNDAECSLGLDVAIKCSEQGQCWSSSWNSFEYCSYSSRHVIINAPCGKESRKVNLIGTKPLWAVEPQWNRGESKWWHLILFRCGWVLAPAVYPSGTKPALRIPLTQG